MAKPAVFLLAYGGPESLNDIPAYLLDIRGGRHTPQELIDEISERYHLIGGRSPLLTITRNVASKLQDRIGLPVYVGMRHWHPFIGDVVKEMAADGVEEFTAICMAPHYSMLSIAKYRQILEQAIESIEDHAGHKFSYQFIESWFDQPAYLDGIANNVRKTLDRWPDDEKNQVMVVFTAHSLPESILERGDPYDAQLRETAELLAHQLKLPTDKWTFSYQSAAMTSIPWLGPQIEDLVVNLAEQGEKNLLIAPIGFIADHVEILYDIDIGVQEIARPLGIRLERTPMLNDDDKLIEALASLAMEAQKVLD